MSENNQCPNCETANPGPEDKAQLVDYSGLFASTLCMIHCLLGPLLLLAIPSLSLLFSHELIHILLLFLIVPFALIAFIRTALHHQTYRPLTVGLVGLVLVACGAFIDTWWIEKNISLETPLTVLGSLILIIAHLINLRVCRHSHARLSPVGR